MADIRVRMQIRYASTRPAPGIDVQVNEVGGRSYEVGRTDAEGRIDAVLRPVRRRRILNKLRDDPLDRPLLDVVLSDQSGNRVHTPPVAVFVLPPHFAPPPPDEPPTVPAGPPGSPTMLADAALVGALGNAAPGWVFQVRRDGAVWADATRGRARDARLGTTARAMTNDTIIHLASMSKTITAVAVAAMRDDWQAIARELANLGQSNAHSVNLRLWVASTGSSSEVLVPRVFAPLFADRGQAARFAPLLPARSHVRRALERFANTAGLEVSPVPAVPPGHFGLLLRAMSGEPVPAWTDPFLPLILDRLGPSPTIGTGVGTITIEDLITHRTDFAGRAPTTALLTAAEQAAIQTVQPAGGAARFDYWTFLRLLLREPAQRLSSTSYGNNNYILLTALIESCTETGFDDYVTRRLFFDARFQRIRRRVVDTAADALYYSGTPANRIGGLRLSDYTAWPGDGGFYATANQLTEWLYVLHARRPVDGVVRRAPLLSASAIADLFGSTGYFSLGIASRAGPAAAAHRFQHNGGTTVNGGGMAGNVAVVLGPSGSVYTALFVANSSIPGGADPPFEAAIAALPWS